MANIQEKCIHHKTIGIGDESEEWCELEDIHCIMAYDQDIWCGMLEYEEDEPIDTESRSWKILMATKKHWESFDPVRKGKG